MPGTKIITVGMADYRVPLTTTTIHLSTDETPCNTFQTMKF